MSDGESEIDDFAQSILQRARLRNQVLNPNASFTGLEEIKKSILSKQQQEGKPLPVLSEESAHTKKSHAGVRNEASSLSKEELKEKDETESKEAREDSEDDSWAEEENKAPAHSDVPMSLGRRKTLKRLGELYGEEGSMPSPVHDHTVGEKTPDPTPHPLTSDKSGGRRGRLNALASTINAWEDDLTHYCSPTSRFHISPPRQPRAVGLGGRSSPRKSNFTTPETKTGRVRTDFSASASNNGVGSLSKTSSSYSNAPSSAMPSCMVVEVNNSNIAKARLDFDPLTNSSMSNSNDKNSAEPASTWDTSLLSALEAQGFVSNASKTKLTYEYNDDELPQSASPGRARSVSPTKHASLFEHHMAGSSYSPIGKRSASTSPVRKPSASPVRNMPVSSTPIEKKESPVRSPPKTYNVVETSTPRGKLSVAQKTALFEPKGPSGSILFQGKQKDPTELSVAERAKLFEQQAFSFVPAPTNNRSISVNRGARLGNPIPNSPGSPKKLGTQVSLPKGTVENQRRLFENALSRREPENEDMEEESHVDADVKKTGQRQQMTLVSTETPPPAFVPPPPPMKVPVPPPLPADPSMNLSVTFSALASQPGTPPRPSRSRSRSPKKHQQSTTPKRSASQSPPRFLSPKASYPCLQNVKRIRVNDPKPGRMYPSLTDIESTETETESEMNPQDEEFDLDYNYDEDMDSETSHVSGSSLGTHIERAAKQNAPRRNRHYRPTEDFSTSLACRQIDAFIDDALEGQSFTMDTIMEAELNAHASSTPTPIACSTSLEGPASSELKEVSTISWQVSNELARLSYDDDSDKTLEEASSSTDDVRPTAVNSTLTPIFKKPLPVVQEEAGNNYDGPETNIDAIFDNSSESGNEGSDQQVEDGEEACNSFEYTDNSVVVDTKDSSPIVTSSPLYPKKKNPSPATTPLVHTVSFFRRQQGQAVATPTRKTPHHSTPDQDLSPLHEAPKHVDSVNDMIKKLEEEMAAQHRSIAQVSKALNLCKSTVEFSESTENVECERVLLIASQKRTVILNEIHRLKTEGVLSKMSIISPTKQDLGPSCRGNMVLNEIEVQLKREFFSKAMNGDTVYHFICLAKYHSQLEASSLISIGNGVSSSKIQGGVLHFPNSFTMGGLEPDFQVKLEIYVLQTMKEFLPHEAKYHIKKQEAKKMTPKKLKHESKLSRAFQQSPAGPDAVRTTNFNICGSLTIDISTLQRNHWNLQGNNHMSPLEGSVAIKIQCSAEGGSEERGFLTMFDDVSGFGAWHRRWCKLTPSQLSFWMYPEDEVANKIPIGTILLRYCVTNRVGPVQREVCARANTFLLVTTRAPQENDKDTLTTSCHPDYTAIRHLLTADTREERDLWCKQINKALANLRAWDPHAHSPDDTLFYK